MGDIHLKKEKKTSKHGILTLAMDPTWIVTQKALVRLSTFEGSPAWSW